MKNNKLSNCDIASRAKEFIPHYLDILKEIVNINSFSRNIEGNNRVQDVIQRELLNIGLDVQRVSCDNCGDILLATTRASGSGDILMLGHADTVFSPSSPFQKMSIVGDRVLGPGACDMKAGLITILICLRVLKELGSLNNFPIRVIINTDEEIGSMYSRAVFLEQLPFIKSAFVFEFGRANNLVVTSRVGSRSFDVKAYGKSAHAGSNFSKGANAIARIAYIANELRQLTNLEVGLTCNVGKIKGGEAVNVVPDYAECSFEFRAERLDILEDATRIANEIVSREVIVGTTTEIEMLYSSSPWVSSPETMALFEEYRIAGGRAGLDYETNTSPVKGSSDANFFGGKGIPTLDGLGPYGEGFHSTDEFMCLSSVLPKTLNFLYWLLGSDY